MCCRRQQRHRRHSPTRGRRSLALSFSHIPTLCSLLSQCFICWPISCPFFRMILTKAKLANTCVHKYEYMCVCVWICIGVRAYIACIYACVNDLYVDVDVVEQLLAAQQQQQSSVSFRRIFALYFRLTLPGNKPNLCCLNCALPFTLQLVVVTLSCCCCCCCWCCVSMWKPYFNGEGNWHCYSLR